MLSQERDAEFRTNGVRVRRDGDERVGTPKQLIRAPDGYVQYAHNLDYGHVHALFVAKTPGLLPAATEAHLWAELSGTRYTTPLLRGWLPYLLAELRRQDALTDLYSHRCAPAILTATPKQLDDIVEQGIRSGKITVDRAAAAGEPAPSKRSVA